MGSGGADSTRNIAPTDSANSPADSIDTIREMTIVGNKSATDPASRIRYYIANAITDGRSCNCGIRRGRRAGGRSRNCS